MIGLGFWRVFLGTLKVCNFGLGSLDHAIWFLIKVFGTQNPGLQTLRVQTQSL